MYCVFVSVEGCVCVSSFTGADKDKRTPHTRTQRVSLESSPTGGFCPGLSSLMRISLKSISVTLKSSHDLISAHHPNTTPLVATEFNITKNYCEICGISSRFKH